MMFRKLLLLIISALLAGCGDTPLEGTANSINAESLLEPIQVLSSDDFKGRAPGTEGEAKTVDYLVSQLKEYGVKGGMPDGSFVQDVPLVGQKTDHDTQLKFSKDGKVVSTLDFRNDFVAWPANMAEEVSLEDAELVYVGYGIQAPEEDWDDFKDIDVEGKIIVIKNNDPHNDPDLFGGKARLYYGRWDYRFEKARDMGALGALIIHTTPSAGYGWDVVANSWSGEQFYLADNEEITNSSTKIDGWLTKEASKDLFASAGLNLNNQLKAAEERTFEPVPLEGITLNLELSASYSNKDAKNVLGVVEGTKDNLKDEYVVFSAHHDHLGITQPVKGDSINNGAVDNASGVSAVLNLARAYKDIQPQLKRSGLFLFVGAEEQGLLGSKYWTANPTVPLGKVNADINLDATNVYGKTEDMVLIGYGRNTLTDVFERAADRYDVKLKPDPHPEEGVFYRSDHFSFAKQGVPSIFPNGGTEFID